MAKPSSREPRRWVTASRALELLRAPSRRALDRWVASGKLQTTVRDGERYYSGPAIDRSVERENTAPARPERRAQASSSEGLSAEEMSVLARPVRRPEPSPRAPSGRDVAESLPRVLEPYISGLHEKIDGLSAQVSSLSEAIEERPRPDPVRVEVVPPEPVSPAAQRTAPAQAHATDPFVAIGGRVRGLDPMDDEGYAEPRRGVSRVALVVIALAIAAATATILLWVMFRV